MSLHLLSNPDIYKLVSFSNLTPPFCLYTSLYQLLLSIMGCRVSEDVNGGRLAKTRPLFQASDECFRKESKLVNFESGWNGRYRAEDTRIEESVSGADYVK